MLIKKTVNPLTHLTILVSSAWTCQANCGTEHGCSYVISPSPLFILIVLGGFILMLCGCLRTIFFSKRTGAECNTRRYQAGPTVVTTMDPNSYPRQNMINLVSTPQGIRSPETIHPNQPTSSSNNNPHYEHPRTFGVAQIYMNTDADPPPPYSVCGSQQIRVSHLEK